jgi:hypothetical protein
MSDFTERRARVAGLVGRGADAAVIADARRALAAVKVRRLVAAETARLGLPEPSSDLEVIGFVADVLVRKEAAL